MEVIVRKIIIFYFLVSLFASISFSQSIDSFFVFKSPKIDSSSAYSQYSKAWGIDVFASNDGFGFGAFYRFEYNKDFFGFASTTFSGAKDDNEVEFTDYYGNQNTPYKKTRVIMIPVNFGLQYRIFRQDIIETFRPYIFASAGPVLLITSPYDIEFFSSIKYAQVHYTIGGSVGIGANFGFDKKNLLGVNIRYYYVPYPKGINILADRVKTSFSGLCLSLNFGVMY